MGTNMRRVRSVSVSITILILALAAIRLPPVSAQLTKISVGYSAISGDSLPAWVAKDAGIFERNGLDVQLVFFTGGTTAVMALVSADTPRTAWDSPRLLRAAGQWEHCTRNCGAA